MPGEASRRTIMLVVAVVVALFAAACGGDDVREVTVVESSSASSAPAAQEVDSEIARAFAPVDAQPANPTVTQLPPPSLPTPSAAPPGPPVPPPPAFAGDNECGVVFPTPAIIVWGIDDANPDDGLWVHDAPGYDSPRQRLLAEDALTQFMTAECQLAADGTPWYEFGSSTGELGYADSTFLQFSQLACLVGMVEARDADGNIAAIRSGPIEGHAYRDAGPLAAFIPNDQIGSGEPYRLVPAESVIFLKPESGAICDLSDRQPELETARAARVDRPDYRGDCATGPREGIGPELLVDIDGAEPIDAVMTTATQPTGEMLFATMTVLIGTEFDGRCTWRDVATLYSGPLDRDDGGQTQHVWSCAKNDGVAFFQYVLDVNPGYSSVTSFTWVDGQMVVESAGIVSETIDISSTCEMSGS